MPPAPHLRHVLITGGSRGIGLAIARLFAEKQYRCTLISRSEPNLRSAIESLQPLPAHLLVSPPLRVTDKHGYVAGDITTGPQFWSISSTSPFGAKFPKGHDASRVDILVNCAGVTQSNLFVKTSDDEIEKIVSTNLTALMMGTRFLLRHRYMHNSARPIDELLGMRFSPTIINVSSLLGISGGFGAVTYAASKAGVLGFTRALAAEYAGHKVRVNAIVPGYVATDMTKDLDEEALKQRIPLGRFGKPEEIAQAALFLAENEYAHNCVLNLDGGLSAV
jgi:NAD(P)-dependent dehydrogenase (short-subunit alcohol dehydrogenase family)